MFKAVGFRAPLAENYFSGCNSVPCIVAIPDMSASNHLAVEFSVQRERTPELNLYQVSNTKVSEARNLTMNVSRVGL